MSITRDVIAVNVQALGAEIFVPRFSALMMLAVMKRAEELHPMPDPKPYEEPMQGALIEGDTLPAKQNPVYQKLVTDVLLKRNEYRQNAIISAVELPAETPRDELVKTYLPVVAPMRQYAALPDDNFVAVMRFCVLTTEEYIQVINAARQQDGLTQGEVHEGLRIFRYEVQRDAPNGNRRKKGTPDIQQAEQVHA